MKRFYVEITEAIDKLISEELEKQRENNPKIKRYQIAEDYFMRGFNKRRK